MKEYLCSRTDTLANKSEGKQTKSKCFFLPYTFVWVATRRNGPDLDHLPTSNDPVKNIPHSPAAWVLVAPDLGKMTTRISHDRYLASQTELLPLRKGLHTAGNSYVIVGTHKNCI